MQTHKDNFQKPWKNWTFRVGGEDPIRVSLMVRRDVDGDYFSQLATLTAKKVEGGWMFKGQFFDRSFEAIQAMEKSLMKEFQHRLG